MRSFPILDQTDPNPARLWALQSNAKVLAPFRGLDTTTGCDKSAVPVSDLGSAAPDDRAVAQDIADFWDLASRARLLCGGLRWF